MARETERWRFSLNKQTNKRSATKIGKISNKFLGFYSSYTKSVKKNTDFYFFSSEFGISARAAASNEQPEKIRYDENNRKKLLCLLAAIKDNDTFSLTYFA